MVSKIVTGGQTGVDMAALEYAYKTGVPYGGWVPKGRTNEDGKIPDRYTGLKETQSTNVAERTRLNVASSDATLVFVDGSTSPGTDQTIVFAKELGKPYFVADVTSGVAACTHQIAAWLSETKISILNIAGPRQSEAPHIGAIVTTILENSPIGLRP